MREQELTFNEWLEKVFVGRPPSWDWMWNNALRAPRARWLVTYPTRLFEEPEILLGRYSYKQLRKGFWNLPNQWELGESIWTRKLPWKLRRSCIRSMVPLFEKFFSRKPLGHTCHMWFDLLRYFGEDRDQRVVDEIYLVLEKILFINSFQCQAAALHGFGHLDHPDKKYLISVYLREHRDLPRDVRRYARAAIQGKVL